MGGCLHSSVVDLIISNVVLVNYIKHFAWLQTGFVQIVAFPWIFRLDPLRFVQRKDLRID